MRLQQQAAKCEFVDKDKQIKGQFIDGCSEKFVAAQPCDNRPIWPFAHMPALTHSPATLLVCVSHLCKGLKSLITFVTTHCGVTFRLLYS